MTNPLTILNATRQQFGWAAAGRLLIDRIGARICHLHIMEVVWIELQQTDTCQPVPGFEFRFLTAQEVGQFSLDTSQDIDPHMAGEIERGESLCFAALDRDQLAAYGWYSIRSAAPRHCYGVGLRLPTDVSYMYKGFTHMNYRGRRLHAAAMGLALAALAKRGIRALISTVEWTNEASLRSCDRLGYQRLGRIVQRGDTLHRTVSIPASIQSLTGVEFVPAEEWPAPALGPLP